MALISVVFASDENYAQHTGVTLLSLLMNKRTDLPVRIFILADNITPESQRRLRSITERYGAALTFIEVDTAQFDLTHKKKHISKVSFARMQMGDFLPENIHKVIYMDTDMIVRHDITELWEIDISDYPIAAVEEPSYMVSPKICTPTFPGPSASRKPGLRKQFTSS